MPTEYANSPELALGSRECQGVYMHNTHNTQEGKAPVAVPGYNALGERFTVGQVAFSHYSMRVGTVGEPDSTGWFRFTYEGGGSDLLDAWRICSLDHARHMGWVA